ncbi:MAG: class I SAM-dependent methyltransferase [Lachnospiraceae bacterium]|nr:class I SAM-dependent methyltransferase [Lachnospiraceae bacterium]
MDNTKVFNELADDYTVGRPIYAMDFIDSLYKQYGFNEDSMIADIGAGTGKFSKQLLDRGSTVYCVEPNDDMRNTAIKELGKYSGFHAVDGTATDTKLYDESVDFITTAQAFHWFDTLLFQKECKRIIRKNGLIFLIWNMRDMSSEMNQKSFEIFSKYCPKFKGFGGGIEQDDIRIQQFFGNKYEYSEFDNPVSYDIDRFISRSLSGSYSLKKGDTDYDRYIEELHRLYEQYAKNDVLVMANKTIVYIGHIS